MRAGATKLVLLAGGDGWGVLMVEVCLVSAYDMYNAHNVYLIFTCHCNFGVRCQLILGRLLAYVQGLQNNRFGMACQLWEGDIMVHQ